MIHFATIHEILQLFLSRTRSVGFSVCHSLLDTPTDWADRLVRLVREGRPSSILLQGRIADQVNGKGPG